MNQRTFLLHRQRGKYTSLSDSRIDLLNKIGFTWGCFSRDDQGKRVEFRGSSIPDLPENQGDEDSKQSPCPKRQKKASKRRSRVSSTKQPSATDINRNELNQKVRALSGDLGDCRKKEIVPSKGQFIILPAMAPAPPVPILSLEQRRVQQQREKQQHQLEQLQGHLQQQHQDQLRQGHLRQQQELQRQHQHQLRAVVEDNILSTRLEQLRYQQQVQQGLNHIGGLSSVPYAASLEGLGTVELQQLLHAQAQAEMGMTPQHSPLLAANVHDAHLQSHIASAARPEGLLHSVSMQSTPISSSYQGHEKSKSAVTTRVVSGDEATRDSWEKKPPANEKKPSNNSFGALELLAGVVESLDQQSSRV